MLRKMGGVYHRRKRAIVLMLVLVMLFAMTAVSQAQTPVPIEIPTDDMITNLNTWIGVLAPIILFIGMIPVALGLLQYLVAMFQRAFRGGRG